MKRENKSALSRRSAKKQQELSQKVAILSNADTNSKIVDDAFENSTMELSAAEYALICRALSDSMNYKPNDNFDAKWQLLLKIKTFQVRMENIELLGQNKPIDGGAING